MNQDIWIEIGGLLAPVLVTAIAAYLGVRAGAAKLTRERAFDRRLQWYEAAVGALVEHGGALQTLARAVREKWSPDVQSALVDRMIQTNRQVSDAVSKAQLYATRTSVEAIAQYLIITAQEYGVRPVNSSDRSEGYTMDVRAIEEVAAHGAQLAEQLSKELRAHLGLEPLTPPGTTRSRFQRGLR